MVWKWEVEIKWIENEVVYKGAETQGILERKKGVERKRIVSLIRSRSKSVKNKVVESNEIVKYVEALNMKLQTSKI